MNSTGISTSIGFTASTPDEHYPKVSDRLLSYLPYVTVGMIAVCAFISSYGMEFLGDDLNHGIRTAEKFPHWYQWPLAIPYQWLTGNGRFGDMAGNLLLAQAPMWLLASLSALMEGLFYLMAIKISFPRKSAVMARLLVLAVIMFAFPWWDSFFLFVCRINYIWTAALTMLSLYMTLFRQKELKVSWCWVLVPVALMAGWGHEACGMPTAAGLCLYFYYGRSLSSLPKTSRWILIALIIGGVLSITSPCSYTRLGSDNTADDPIVVLLLKTSFIALALILAIGATYCCKSVRKKLTDLCRTPWIVFASASISSMLFVAVGGIVGRSGLFSQMFGLIAICILIRNLIGDGFSFKEGPTATIASIVLFIIMTAHECGVCVYQMKANSELTQCRLLYEASPDGVIYASPMQRDQFPWWTLRKNKACVDNDDYWYIEVYDHRLGHDRKHYRLLPESLHTLQSDEADSEHLNAYGWIERTKPKLTTDSNLLVRDGEQYTVVEFTASNGQTLYYISPRIVDPGDR